MVSSVAADLNPLYHVVCVPVTAVLIGPLHVQSVRASVRGVCFSCFTLNRGRNCFDCDCVILDLFIYYFLQLYGSACFIIFLAIRGRFWRLCECFQTIKTGKETIKLPEDLKEIHQVHTDRLN